MTQLPNPIPGPSWWQLIQWIANPLQFQDRCSQQYGDVFTMNLAQHGGYVVIGNPRMIQDLFSQDSKFNTGCGNAIAAPLVGQNSLMLMDGDRHKRERKLLMPSFHGERLHTYASQICAIAQQVADHWPVGQPFIMRTATQHISLELILQIVFGLDIDNTNPSSPQNSRHQQIKPLLTQWLDMIDSPLRSSVLFFKFLQKDWGKGSPWGKMKHQQNQVHQLLHAEISDRRTHGNAGRTDMLSLMMAAQDETGQGMTNEELRDELITILFAGHETVATTLSWALYEIHRQPAVYDKLRHELESLGDNPAPMDIAQLPYLSAVCQEALRMYPVLPVIFPRISKVPVTLAGHEFDANTVLMPSIYLVHYREDLYPNARQFKPERFFERQYSPWEYLPFGGGSRRCLGYALAQLEMKLVLATLLSRCQLALLEKQPVQPQRRGFTISPKGGVKMAVTATR